MLPYVPEVADWRRDLTHVLEEAVLETGEVPTSSRVVMNPWTTDLYEFPPVPYKGLSRHQPKMVNSNQYLLIS